MPEKVRVYFDYLCPFAWRGAELCEMVAKRLELTFEWRHFSLYQSNYQGNGHWQLWNDKLDAAGDDGHMGLLPFLASCAARKQGEDKHNAFRLALLRSRHLHREALDLATINKLAAQVGLHVPRFECDLADPECRTSLAQEHFQGARLNIFGTPTFLFENGHVAYLRIKTLPHDENEACQLFQDYRHLLERYPYLETVKRPREKQN